MKTSSGDRNSVRFWGEREENMPFCFKEFAQSIKEKDIRTCFSHSQGPVIQLVKMEILREVQIWCKLLDYN